MLILAFDKVFFSTSGFGPAAAHAVRRAPSATSRPRISGNSRSITQKETPVFECDREKTDPDDFVALQRDVTFRSKSKMFLPYLPGGIYRCGSAVQFDISRSFSFFFYVTYTAIFQKWKIQT